MLNLFISSLYNPGLKRICQINSTKIDGCIDYSKYTLDNKSFILRPLLSRNFVREKNTPPSTNKDKLLVLFRRTSHLGVN